MNPNVKSASPVAPYVVKLVDAALILLAAYLALHARRVLDLPTEMPVKFIAGYDGLAVIGAMLFSFFSGRVSSSWRGAQMPAMLAKLTARWFVVVGLLLLWLFAFKATQEFSRVWFAMWMALAAVLLWLGRLGIYLVLRSMRLLSGLKTQRRWRSKLQIPRRHRCHPRFFFETQGKCFAHFTVSNQANFCELHVYFFCVK